LFIGFFRDASGEAHEGAYWFDLLSLHGAEPMASYDDRWFRGIPAVTLNSVGKGRVCYVGTVPEVPYLRKLLEKIYTEAGITPNVTDSSSPLIESLKVFRSSDRDGEHLHLINFTAEEQSVTLPSAHVMVPDGLEVSGRFMLPAFGSAFLKRI
jgi:beta-galactosidase